MILFIIVAVLYIGIVIFYAQMIAPKEYSVKENTINELGSQTYDNRNVMQWGYRGFGLILLGGIIINRSTLFRDMQYTIPLFLYGLGMILSGLFGPRPFEPMVFYMVKESKLNNFFNQLSGYSMAILIVMKLIMAVGRFNRVLNLLMVIFVLYTSIMSGRKESNRGLYQRVLYLGTFLWLIYAYSGMMN